MLEFIQTLFDNNFIGDLYSFLFNFGLDYTVFSFFSSLMIVGFVVFIIRRVFFGG